MWRGRGRAGAAGERVFGVRDHDRPYRLVGSTGSSYRCFVDAVVSRIVAKAAGMREIPQRTMPRERRVARIRQGRR